MEDQIEALIFRARVAEQAECYPEMLQIVTELAQFNYDNAKDFTDEERKILSIAFKKLIEENRQAIKKMNVVMKGGEEFDRYQGMYSQFQVFRQKIQKDLSD